MGEYTMKKRLINAICNERGVATLLTTLYVTPIVLFLCFSIVPIFVYVLKQDHLSAIISHSLKEAEDTGYVSPTVIANTNTRLAALGLGAVTVGGTNYPSYVGSTTTKVLKDDPNPTITIVIKYPAPNLTKMLTAIGGTGSGQVNEGFYYLTLYGKSEAFN
jgi:hypothetical protein